MYGFISGTVQKSICLPPNITAGQARLITEKFMREHPEELHEGAPTLTARALYIAYACKRSQP
jgi:hypothetical protein